MRVVIQECMSVALCTLPTLISSRSFVLSASCFLVFSTVSIVTAPQRITDKRWVGLLFGFLGFFRVVFFLGGFFGLFFDRS